MPLYALIRHILHIDAAVDTHDEELLPLLTTGYFHDTTPTYEAIIDILPRVAAALFLLYGTHFLLIFPDTGA